MTKPTSDKTLPGRLDYDLLVDMFNQALIHTLRKHSVAESFLELWVPDEDPVVGIASMVDSARLASLPRIEIQFQKTTVPAERLPELERTLAVLCKPTFEIGNDRVVLRATGMKADIATAAADARVEPKAAWQPTSAPVTQHSENASQRWSEKELAELADVHPHFRPGLKAALANLTFEGTATADKTLTQVSAQEGPATLTLFVDKNTHTVRQARHAGAARPSERAVLDLFCKAAENVPIQEVADHVSLKLLDQLIDDEKGPPVAGVLLPVNAGPSFALAALLARRAYESYREQTGAQDGINFFYPAPSSEWQALLPDERAAKVDYVLRAFLQSEGLYPDDIGLLRVEKNRYGHYVRVIIGFSDRVPVGSKPTLMRRLERRLRRDAEPEIDLVAERAKDSSPLRRLS